jgi:imidazole glycerol-phosphate synthase subunit HisH
MTPIRMAIIDYGLGNLFSIKHACEYAGMEAVISASPDEISASDGVILPGVGAFADAMDSLLSLKLDSLVKELAEKKKPLVGVCLGMQLLFCESNEFGAHSGLDLIKGQVRRFEHPNNNGTALKVPQIGWNRLIRKNSWDDSPLARLDDQEFMYFVHSYCCYPDDPAVVLSETDYGGEIFCSSLISGNIFGCQFHPERSARAGLKIYENIKNWIERGINH